MKKNRNTIHSVVQLHLMAAHVYFNAMEVDTQGFCAESIRNCLPSLGFNKKLCRKTLQENRKTLSSVSLRYSFEVLLCQNYKSWALDHPVPMFNLELLQKKCNLNGVSAPNNQFLYSSLFFTIT